MVGEESMLDRLERAAEWWEGLNRGRRSFHRRLIRVCRADHPKRAALEGMKRRAVWQRVGRESKAREVGGGVAQVVST